MNSKLQVLDQEIGTYAVNNIEYICITDIARYKSSTSTDDLIRNWLRNRNTVEFNTLAISQMKVLLRSTNHLQTNKNEHSKKLQ